ncbi:phage scaffolding protein [Jeotgalibacillus campisalis]|uniref:Scaffolding protein n=1 Tax=Jeotgalibacillus campisalis TaxID=220754 RepID=A0A0C2RWN1_9BACL|nr:phage scaffolding protein [Jeotgalibacillus campisalis]KIL46164.1 hypothetical protein KR50_28390 [Jeotgalibacillus campisalis]
MDLKELLGEELYNQVIEKAGDNKLGIINDGSWIPKEKFDGKLNEIKDLQNDIKDRDDQLESLGKKAKGHDDLTDEINRLKKENADKDADYQEKMAQRDFDDALKDALNSAKARNIKSVKANLDIEKIKLDGDKLIGLDDQLSALKESDAYLFAETEEPAGLSGRSPRGAGQQPPGSYNKPNPFKKESLNLTEQGRLLRDDPDLAKKLQAQA